MVDLSKHVPGARTGIAVKADPASTTDYAAVLEALRAHGGAGWVCTTGEVFYTADFAAPASGLRILSAELSKGHGPASAVRDPRQGSSISVRWRSGVWVVTTVREVSPGTADAEEVVALEDRFLASVAPPDAGRVAYVYYATYWRRPQAMEGAADAPRPWQPWVAAFLGIGGKNEVTP